MSISSDFLVS